MMCFGNDASSLGCCWKWGGEATGPTHVVAGVGINTRLPQRDAEHIDQPWVDLSRIPGIVTDSRNRLAALLIGELVGAMELYGRQGLRPFIAHWSSFDRFKGEIVDLRIGPREVKGEYLGIAEDGGIRMQVDGEVHSYKAGEVSLCRKFG